MLPIVAFGGVVAETNNNIGGKIVLLSEKCENGTSYLAYSVANGQSTLIGCWAMDESHIHIKWSDGDIRSYPMHVWTTKRDKTY